MKRILLIFDRRFSAKHIYDTNAIRRYTQACARSSCRGAGYVAASAEHASLSACNPRPLLEGLFEIPWL